MRLSGVIRKLIRENKKSFAQLDLNENFWEWFGDSKIRDGVGPIVCYHGSPSGDIRSFDIGRIGSNKGNYGHYGYGIYFSTDIREARTYGDNIYECFVKMSKPFTGSDEQILELKDNGVSGIDEQVITSIDFDSFKESFKDEPFIYEFIDDHEKLGSTKAWRNAAQRKDRTSDLELLNDIDKLLDYSTLNKDVHGVPDHVLDDLKRLGVNPRLNKGFPYSQALHWITDLGNKSKEVTDVIKELGYDGVWYGSEIVVFNLNQIKSIKNDGTWDNYNDDIYS